MQYSIEHLVIYFISYNLHKTPSHCNFNGNGTKCNIHNIKVWCQSTIDPTKYIQLPLDHTNHKPPKRMPLEHGNHKNQNIKNYKINLIWNELTQYKILS